MACSTSRNTGTRNTGTPEHHGTFRNTRKTRNTPQKPGAPAKNPEHPQENREHREENPEHPPKNPEKKVERRKERRTYKDPQTGQLCTPTRESDAHYHLRVACIQAAEPSFVPCSLVIPDGLPLTECHKNYITKEFGLRAC